MGHTLKMSGIRSERVSEEGRKAARTFLASSVGAELNDALSAGDAFNSWEVKVIVDSVVEVMRRDGKVEGPALTEALRSRDFPKDLAEPLAEVLSRPD
jgi:hypothetical protein